MDLIRSKFSLTSPQKINYSDIIRVSCHCGRESWRFTIISDRNEKIKRSLIIVNLFVWKLAACEWHIRIPLMWGPRYFHSLWLYSVAKLLIDIEMKNKKRQRKKKVCALLRISPWKKHYRPTTIAVLNFQIFRLDSLTDFF